MRRYREVLRHCQNDTSRKPFCTYTAPKGRLYGARPRKSYEGQGCAELHLGRGTTPRPDTLAQTGQITRKAACGRGGSSLAGWRGRALTCEKPSCLRILPIVRSW